MTSNMVPFSRLRPARGSGTLTTSRQDQYLKCPEMPGVDTHFWCPDLVRCQCNTSEACRVCISIQQLEDIASSRVLAAGAVLD